MGASESVFIDGHLACSLNPPATQASASLVSQPGTLGQPTEEQGPERLVGRSSCAPFGLRLSAAHRIVGEEYVDFQGALAAGVAKLASMSTKWTTNSIEPTRPTTGRRLIIITLFVHSVNASAT